MSPSIKDFCTINKALDKSVDNVSVRRNDISILTDEEERLIVSYMRNKNRAAQGIKCKDCVKMVYDFLTIRSQVNKKSRGGRKYVPLSRAVRSFLLTKTSQQGLFGGRLRHVITSQESDKDQHQARLVFLYIHVMYAGFSLLEGGGGGGGGGPTHSLKFCPPPPPLNYPPPPPPQ